MSRILLIADPSAVAGSPGRTVTLRWPIDPFDSRHGVCANPPGRRPSFSFQVAEDFLLLCERAQLGLFDSPGKDNWLFLPGPQADHLLILGPEGTPYWYRRASPAELDPAFGESFAARRGACTFLYRQTERAVLAYKTLRLRLADAPPGYGPCGCLNPLVLRLPGYGTDIHSGGPGGVYRRAAEAALVAVPVLPGEDARLPAWLEVARRATARGGPPSTIEALLFGPRPGSAFDPEAFCWLDGLGGTFVVAPPGTGPARYGWVAPPTPMAHNLAWLHRRVLAAWGGDGIAPVAVEIPVPARAAPNASAALRSVVLSDDEASLAVRSARECLSAFAPRGPAFELAGAVLAHPAVAGTTAAGAHAGAFASERLSAGRARLTLDAVAFLDAFARAAFLPRSPVRLALPHAPTFVAAKGVREATAASHRSAVGRVFLDLHTSPPPAGFRFLSSLARALAGGPLPTRPRHVEYADGWWEIWRDTLFSAAWEVGAAFRVPGGGFVIGASRLGSGLARTCNPPTTVVPRRY